MHESVNSMVQWHGYRTQKLLNEGRSYVVCNACEGHYSTVI